eukprot:1380332-Amphidinium_carterae.1
MDACARHATYGSSYQQQICTHEELLHVRVPGLLHAARLSDRAQGTLQLQGLTPFSIHFGQIRDGQRMGWFYTLCSQTNGAHSMQEGGQVVANKETNNEASEQTKEM